MFSANQPGSHSRFTYLPNNSIQRTRATKRLGVFRFRGVARGADRGRWASDIHRSESHSLNKGKTMGIPYQFDEVAKRLTDARSWASNVTEGNRCAMVLGLALKLKPSASMETMRGQPFVTEPDSIIRLVGVVEVAILQRS